MDLLQRALDAYRQGRLEEAGALANRLVAERPDDVEALHFGGIVAYGEKRFALSAERLAKAAKLAPNSAETHHNLGAALRR